MVAERSIGSESLVQWFLDCIQFTDEQALIVAGHLLHRMPKYCHGVMQTQSLINVDNPTEFASLLMWLAVDSNKAEYKFFFYAIEASLSKFSRKVRVNVDEMTYLFGQLTDYRGVVEFGRHPIVGWMNLLKMSALHRKPTCKTLTASIATSFAFKYNIKNYNQDKVIAELLSGSHFEAMIGADFRLTPEQAALVALIVSTLEATPK